MSKLLSIGRIENEFAVKVAIDVAKKTKAVPTTMFGRVKTGLVSWLNCQKEIREWDHLNEASVTSFLSHAAELEGLSVEGRIGNSQWSHLPDYEETYWLPFDFPAARVFTMPDGWPIEIASANGLLKNLDAMKSASLISLGEKPTLPDPDLKTSMSRDIAARWTWICLYDAASLALANKAPLALLP